MAAARPQASRWASQAALDALLRYNPQRAALREQIREAGENYGNTVRAGRVTAKETEASAQRALPQIAQAYSKADAATGAGATLVSSGLAALPGQDSYKAGQLGEVQQQIANLAKARASSTTAMLDRGVRAREGAQFSQLNAQSTLTRALQTLFNKGQTLSQEQGAFTQSQAEKLAHEAEGLEQQERASQRSANTSRSNAQLGASTTIRGQNMTAQSSAEGRAQKKWEHEHPNKKGGGNETAPGVKEQSVQAHNSARSTIETIRREAYEIRGQRRQYGQAKDYLEHAVPTEKGETGRAAHPYNGLLKAGLDLAYYGGLGAGTIKQLHSEGFGVGKLGYPVYKAPPPQANFFDTVRKAAESLGGR